MHSIECPSCGHNLKYADEDIGKNVGCQKCGNAFALPPNPQSKEASLLLVPGHPEIKELVPVLCEHCSESFKIHGAIGAMIQCGNCHKTTSVALLDTSKLPGPHGPGERGCVPGFRGDPAHYRVVYEAGARARARRQQLLNEGVLPGLLVSKMLDEQAPFYIPDVEGGLRLAGAYLRGALFFMGTAFESADLSGGTLDGCSWVSTSLSNAQFDGASLQGCSIGGLSELSGASFCDADLSGSRLELYTYGGVNRIDFTGANLMGATLEVGSFVDIAKLIFKNAQMEGCKVPETLLPVLSEEQRAEVEAVVSEEKLEREERKLAGERHRRFRSVPILKTESQTHSFGANAGSITAIQTTYVMGDAREHVLEDYVKRHWLSWVWPLAGLAAAALGLTVAAVGYTWFGWNRGGLFGLPLLAGMAGAIGGWLADVGSRRLYRRQAWKDRGWKAGEERPALRIIFEHDWRQFASNFR